MNALRPLGLHVGLLLLACSSALYVWTRDLSPAPRLSAGVQIWAGAPNKIERIVYESKQRRVVLQTHVDSEGRWYEGIDEKDSDSRPQSASGPRQDTPSRVSTRIVSIRAGDRIAQELGTLKAIRDLGPATATPLSDFGLDTPQARLSVTEDSIEHKLIVGAKIPGGTDRYVQYENSGRVFAIQGDVLRDLEAGQAALNERELHDFEFAQIDTVRLRAGNQEKTLVLRSSATKSYWANIATATTPDETATTWLTRLSRLIPTEYVSSSSSEALKEHPLFRVEYHSKSTLRGFLEFAKLSAPTAGSEYYLKTERTRLYARVSEASGEQVEQDLSTLLK